MELSINLLCQYKPEDVLVYVKKKYYPSKMCLDICKRYKANHALAYLYKHTGLYVESLEAYVIILNEIAKDFYDYNIIDKQLEEKLIEYNKYFLEVVNGCLKYITLAGKSEEEKLPLR